MKLQQIQTPVLVQRCYFNSDGKLAYEYMGRSEYEMGSCQQSMKRIFAAGQVTSTQNITMGQREIPVHMIAGRGFRFKNYEVHLQQMAKGNVRLLEMSGFPEKVAAAVNPPKEKVPTFQEVTTVWFDIGNDVLWTINKEVHEKLLKELFRIKLKWAENARKIGSS
ncbi:MAG: hypothetical protein V4690_02155 [Patescibacteria group bacterium]